MRALLIVLDLADAIPGTGWSRTETQGPLPALDSLGFWKATTADVFHPRAQRVRGSWGRLRAQSRGTDAISGFWELAGVILKEPLPTFSRFPEEFVRAIERDAGVEFIGNRAASGLAILEEFGAEHLRTRKPILYTSSDSVLQIAAHEETVPLPKLYEICRVARRHSDKRRIGRVIARPFRGKPGSFERTANRRDHAMPPPRTALNAIAEAGFQVEGIGHVSGLFAGSGITRSHPISSPEAGMEMIEQIWAGDEEGLIFARLSGPEGVEDINDEAENGLEMLQQFDAWLQRFEPRIEPDDLLLITFMHPSQITFPGAARRSPEEPLLMLHGDHSGPLGTRRTSADVAATLCEYFRLRRPWPIGDSFLRAPARRSHPMPLLPA
jgi:phosphopentomutase